MRIAPLLAAFVAAAGVVDFSSATGQTPPPKAKTADGDLVRMQGEWTVTKVELPVGAVPADLLKDVRVTIRENRVTAEFAVTLAGKQETEYALLMLDSTRTPRHMDITRADATWQPRRDIAYKVAVTPDTDRKVTKIDKGLAPPTPAAYRLDGDTLTVCIPNDFRMPRPTELKVAPPKNPEAGRREDQGYVLIQLTKKK